MSELQELCRITAELIEVLQVEAAELERIVTHLEQQTVRLDHPCQLPVVVSDLSALHVRIKKLGERVDSAI
jgi:hypothetical protein